VQDHVKQRIVNLQPPVVLDETQLPKLFMNVLTCDRRGADNLRERFLADLRYDRRRFVLSLPKFAISRSTRARRFSLELKADPTKSASTRAFRAQQERHERLGKTLVRRGATRTTADLSSRMNAFGHCGDRRQAQPAARQTALAKEIPLP